MVRTLQHEEPGMAASTKRDYDFLFKLVLIGDSGVGKSCLLLRFSVSSRGVVLLPSRGHFGGCGDSPGPERVLFAG
jgi:hypothetical protein